MILVDAPIGECPLRPLGAVEQLVQRDGVVQRVDAGISGELLGQEGGDPVVPVLAAEVVVAGRGQHGDLFGRDPGDGHVERAAAEVVDQDRLIRPRLLEPVGEGRGGRLVDDPQDLQPGGAPGLDRRLALGVGEVGGHGDDRAIDRLSQLRLGVLAEPLQDERREARGVVVAPVEVEAIERAAHVGLEEAGDLVIAQPRPLLRLLPDRRGFRPEVDDRRRDVLPVAVRDHLRPSVGVAVRRRRSWSSPGRSRRTWTSASGLLQQKGDFDRSRTGIRAIGSLDRQERPPWRVRAISVRPAERPDDIGAAAMSHRTGSISHQNNHIIAIITINQCHGFRGVPGSVGHAGVVKAIEAREVEFPITEV